MAEGELEVPLRDDGESEGVVEGVLEYSLAMITKDTAHGGACPGGRSVRVEELPEDSLIPDNEGLLLRCPGRPLLFKALPYRSLKTSLAIDGGGGGYRMSSCPSRRSLFRAKDDDEPVCSLMRGPREWCPIQALPVSLMLTLVVPSLIDDGSAGSAGGTGKSLCRG